MKIGNKLKNWSLSRTFALLILLCYSTYIIIPILWIIFASLKDSAEIFQNPIALPRVFLWDNYLLAWNGGIKNYFLNSTIVAMLSTVGVLLSGGMLAYALARLKNKYNKFVYVIAIMCYAVPMHGVIVPLYILESRLDLLNNLIGLTLPTIAFGLPFAVIVLHSFLLGFPKEMEEAASIDGANHFRLFFQIVVPVTRPAFITVAIFQIVNSWNSFLLPSLLLTNDKVKTITVGLTSFQGQWGSDWGVLTAAIIISVIPLLVIYVLFQKHLVNSVGGMSKG